MSETVLVTGGAGFIGVPTVSRLLEQGHQVVVVDNYAVGSRDRLDHLVNDPANAGRLDIVELDLRDAVATAKAVADIAPNKVIHLAAHHFIPFCKAHPAETINVNVSGTQNLLDALLPVQPERLLFASTADVYTPAPVPHIEHDTTEPDNIYGMSKLMGEKLMEFHHQRAQKPTLSVSASSTPSDLAKPTLILCLTSSTMSGPATSCRWVTPTPAATTFTPAIWPMPSSDF